MDVVLWHRRHVEVDDVPERRDVDTARRDVRGDQHAVLAALEAGERLGALVLRAVAVDAFDLDALLGEEAHQLVGAVLRPGEDQRVVDLAAAEQFEQQPRLQVLRHRVDGLGDTDGRRRLALEVDRRRVLQHLVGQLRNRGRHGRAEEQRLATRREVPEDAADVRQEPHVEHAVRFVEDEILQPLQLAVGRLEMVEQTARRGDDDVDARAEGVLLRPHADAAEDGGRRQRRVHREVVEVGDDLRRELTRRRQHECARRAALLGHQLVQQRQQEGRGLAAAGRGAGEEIPARKRGRDRIGLNRSGTGESEVLDPGE